mmetsp:Transcript_12606/g.34760  ORF Transcript_12606/g.34760 Transcript_12606/m.34760 type:complete len:324 (-) Transcript_12606:1376-2347(-)
MVAAGDGAARRWILREDLVRSTLAAFFDVGDHGTDGARPDNRLWEMSVDEAMDIITKGAEPADRARLGNDLAATLEAGLLAAGCLRVYLLERELPEMGLSDGVLSNEVKTYWGPFQRLDAGWGLAGVVWHGVEALERSRRYKESADVLRAILATPFQMHRRGVMFDRLALDLQHLGQRADALEACLAGLADKSVAGCDRLALQRRALRLQRREMKGSSCTVPDEDGLGFMLDGDIMSDMTEAGELRRILVQLGGPWPAVASSSSARKRNRRDGAWGLAGCEVERIRGTRLGLRMPGRKSRCVDCIDGRLHGLRNFHGRVVRSC